MCGDRLGRFIAFVGGPLWRHNLYAHPPAHVECAEFSAKVCPFLTIPTAQRRESNKPTYIEMPGEQVVENPEVTGILITTDYGMLPQEILLAKEAREFVGSIKDDQQSDQKCSTPSRSLANGMR